VPAAADFLADIVLETESTVPVETLVRPTGRGCGRCSLHDLGGAAEYRLDAAEPREPGYLVLARVLLAQGRPGQTLALLDRLHAAAVAQDRGGSLIETGALRALTLAATGEEAEAVNALAGALTSPARRATSGSSPTRDRRWPRYWPG
jgi:hypothetical protein